MLHKRDGNQYSCERILIVFSVSGKIAVLFIFLFINGGSYVYHLAVEK